MSKIHETFSFSPRAFLLGTNITFVVVYLALIAFVMSYAALTVEFSQSVRNDEAAVGTLDGQYLAALSSITESDPVALGYRKPVASILVSALPEAAVSVR